MRRVFVRFLVENEDTKRQFEISWPLALLWSYDEDKRADF